jgi:hypothetical protein
VNSRLASTSASLKEIAAKTVIVGEGGVALPSGAVSSVIDASIPSNRPNRAREGRREVIETF